MLEFILVMGGLDSIVARGELCIFCVLLASIPRRVESCESIDEPDPPESLVCTIGRSITLGPLMSPSLLPCENRTDRGDTSVLMAEEKLSLRLRLGSFVSSVDARAC